MITQALSPFNSTKQAIEGTKEFRANASYSWSWLIEHTNQQNILINQINSTATEMNTYAQTVTTKAQQVNDDKAIVNQAKLDAQSARDSALAAKSAVETIYDTFDDRYLGAKNIEPILDNDGNALQSGALYFNSTAGKLFIYDLVGNKWVDMSHIPTLFSSLSDIAISNKSNGDILIYDSNLGKWKNYAGLLDSINNKISKISNATANILLKTNTNGDLEKTGISIFDDVITAKGFNGVGTFPTGENQNLNDITIGGYYNYVKGNYTTVHNAPPVVGYGTLLVISGTGFTSQVVIEYSSALMYIRSMTGGTWSPWKKFITDSELNAEGSFTVNLAGDTSSGSWSTSHNYCKYIKIGKFVHVWGYVSGILSGATGNVRLVGLPFISESSASTYPNLSFTYVSGLNFSGSASACIENGTNYANVKQGGTSAGIPVANQYIVFMFSGAYTTNQ